METLKKKPVIRQRALFNVLRAFANYDEEVGYCQGMTNIVATILMYCEEEVNSCFYININLSTHFFLIESIFNPCSHVFKR